MYAGRTVYSGTDRCCLAQHVRCAQVVYKYDVQIATAVGHSRENPHSYRDVHSKMGLHTSNAHTSAHKIRIYIAAAAALTTAPMQQQQQQQ
eukprot:18762-Heterococcus_DN1.PRE.3